MLKRFPSAEQLKPFLYEPGEDLFPGVPLMRVQENGETHPFREWVAWFQAQEQTMASIADYYHALRETSHGSSDLVLPLREMRYVITSTAVSKPPEGMAKGSYILNRGGDSIPIELVSITHNLGSSNPLESKEIPLYPGRTLEACLEEEEGRTFFQSLFQCHDKPEEMLATWAPLARGDETVFWPGQDCTDNTIMLCIDHQDLRINFAINISSDRGMGGAMRVLSGLDKGMRR